MNGGSPKCGMELEASTPPAITMQFIFSNKPCFRHGEKYCSRCGLIHPPEYRPKRCIICNCTLRTTSSYQKKMVRESITMTFVYGLPDFDKGEKYCPACSLVHPAEFTPKYCVLCGSLLLYVPNNGPSHDRGLVYVKPAGDPGGKLLKVVLPRRLSHLVGKYCTRIVQADGRLRLIISETGGEVKISRLSKIQDNPVINLGKYSRFLRPGSAYYEYRNGTIILWQDAAKDEQQDPDGFSGKALIRSFGNFSGVLELWLPWQFLFLRYKSISYEKSSDGAHVFKVVDSGGDLKINRLGDWVIINLGRYSGLFKPGTAEVEYKDGVLRIRQE